MAEDLEEFSRKRNASGDGESRSKGPTRGRILIQLVMKEISEHHEPKRIANDVYEFIPGKREIMKGDPTDLTPVWVSDKITQWKERRNCQDNE